MIGSSSRAGRASASRPSMFPGGVLVQLTDEGERLAEESRRAVIADDDAFLEPLISRQRDSGAAAPKQLLLRSEPG